MNLPVREMRRQRRPFLLLTGGLTVIALLLVVLGGLAQGLVDGFSGVLRAQDADLLVYSQAANDSVVRSRVTADQRDAIAAVDGVASVGGLGISLVAARQPDGGETLDVAVVGDDTPPGRLEAPPEPGQAYADERLRDDGVRTGDVLEVGAGERAVEVVGFVDDTSYLLNGGLWVEPGTWRAIHTDAHPDTAPPRGGFQVLTVQTEPGDDAHEVAARIDQATSGATRTLTKAAAVDAIPGLAESAGTLDAVGYLVLVVALLVAALFFSLVVVERLPLYAVLKALGASTRRLVAGVAAQAATCAAIAVIAATVLGLALAASSPPGTPMALPPGRLMGLLVTLELATVAGAVTALRRIHRVDPVTAIGTGS